MGKVRISGHCDLPVPQPPLKQDACITRLTGHLPPKAKYKNTYPFLRQACVSLAVRLPTRAISIPPKNRRKPPAYSQASTQELKSLRYPSPLPPGIDLPSGLHPSQRAVPHLLPTKPSILHLDSGADYSLLPLEALRFTIEGIRVPHKPHRPSIRPIGNREALPEGTHFHPCQLGGTAHVLWICVVVPTVAISIICSITKLGNEKVTYLTKDSTLGGLKKTGTDE